MAQLLSVRLNRVDAQPWGLRLQGGADFGTPLVVQKVSRSRLFYLQKKKEPNFKSMRKRYIILISSFSCRKSSVGILQVILIC